MYDGLTYYMVINKFINVKMYDTNLMFCPRTINRICHGELW